MLIRVLVFLLLNFLALGIGGFFTGAGVSSGWYQELAKAPWTPPGWVFGFAWTSIMLCFSFFMAILWTKAPDKKLLAWLYLLQWFLNVLWNPAFFHFHQTLIAMLDIAALTLLIAWFLWSYRQQMGWKSSLILPYLLWLCIASSLNAYIVLCN